MKTKLIVITVDRIEAVNYNTVREVCQDKVINIIKTVYGSYNNEVVDVTCSDNEIIAIRRDNKYYGKITGAVYTFTVSYRPNEKLVMYKINQMNENLYELISNMLYEKMDSTFDCLSMDMFDII